MKDMKTDGQCTNQQTPRARARAAYHVSHAAYRTPTLATCALCGWRNAVDREEVDGRSVAVCGTCISQEVPTPTEPPSMRARILRALARSDGLDIIEIAENLGEDDAPGRARISAALARAIRARLVTCTGGKMSRTYRLVVRGGR